MSRPLHLSLLIGPAVPRAAPPELMDALAGVEVTTGGERGAFQLSFGLSKRSPISTTLLPAGLFDPGIRVIVVATVDGVPYVLMDGVVTRQEVAPSDVPGMSTLTVTGEDLTVLMDIVDFQIPYPAMGDWAIANLILLKYAPMGIVPVVVPPVLIDVPLPTHRINTQSGTDLELLKCAASEVGHVFFLQPGPVPGRSIAYWGPEIRIGSPQPALTLNTDGETNVESATFSYDGLKKTLPILIVQLEATKTPIPVPVPDVSVLRPPLAARPATPLKVELTKVANLNPIRAALFGLAKASDSSDVVTCEGRLDVLRYGRPLQARALVGVRGAGIAYDGLYYVKSVTHSVKRGEYKQKFKLAREGLLPTTPKVPV